MCFRPTSASRTLKCPKCGKEINMMGGIKPKKCPFCGAELVSAEKANKKDS